jgi:hypothetical protein
MAVEEVRTRIRGALEATLGVEGVDYLLDRPSGGWNDLATKADLEALDTRLDLRFAEVDRHFAEVDRHFADVDRRFADVDRRFADIDRRFGELDAKFEHKFGELDKRLDRQFAATDHKIDALDERVRMTISSTVDRAITTATWRLASTMIAAVAILGLLVKL